MNTARAPLRTPPTTAVVPAIAFSSGGSSSGGPGEWDPGLRAACIAGPAP
ncbi:hypothetical protein [Streptomyces sp. NBC_00690]|nr:hypothetical protein [Streptomyces sp. NBC_00690]